MFLSKNGKFNSKIEFQEGRNVFLRKRQYQILDDEAAGRTLAASIIRGKIQNQVNFMQRIGIKKAVLSFLYTLLLYRVDSYVEMVGLDPYVGYLHTLSYGKRALTFDLMEEYRTSIADTLCCALFNLGILNKSDFNSSIFSVDDDNQPLDTPVEVQEGSNVIESAERLSGVLLTADGLKKVSAQFEEKMATTIFYPLNADKISYQ